MYKYRATHQYIFHSNHHPLLTHSPHLTSSCPPLRHARCLRCLCLSLAPLVLCFAAAVAPTPLNMTPPLTLSSPPTQPQVFRYRPCTLLGSSSSPLTRRRRPQPQLHIQPPSERLVSIPPTIFKCSAPSPSSKSLQRRHWSHQRLDYPVFVSLVQDCPSGFKIPRFGATSSAQLQIQTPGPQFYQNPYTRVQERSFESSRLPVRSLWLTRSTCVHFAASARKITLKLSFKSTLGGWIVIAHRHSGLTALTALTLGLDGVDSHSHSRCMYQQAESTSVPSLEFKTGFRSRRSLALLQFKACECGWTLKEG
ncbi:hypothetical protein C8R43DRAFT_986030 [Mycena crocata]|nr:hypothetical protein C8R43DRAFT_986030 [Mycena crocata]